MRPVFVYARPRPIMGDWRGVGIGTAHGPHSAMVTHANSWQPFHSDPQLYGAIAPPYFRDLTDFLFNRPIGRAPVTPRPGPSAQPHMALSTIDIAIPTLAGALFY